MRSGKRKDMDALSQNGNLQKSQMNVMIKPQQNLNRRNEEGVDVLFHVALSTEAVTLAGRRYVGPSQPNRKMEQSKVWWEKAYNNWDDEHFKNRFKNRSKYGTKPYWTRKTTGFNNLPFSTWVFISSFH